MSIIKMQPERIRRLLREGSWIFSGQAMGVIGAMVGVRLMTELLSPASYGELALGITLATLVSQVLLFPLGNGAARFYALALKQHNVMSYLTALKRLLFSIIGTVIFIILIAVAGLLIVGKLEWIAMVIAALMLAILLGCSSIMNNIQNAARQRSVAAVHNGMNAWARFMAAAGLVLLLGSTSTVAMLGYVLGLIPLIALQFLFFRKNIVSHSSSSYNNDGEEWSKQIYKYSWPLAVLGLLNWMQLSSDRWALGLFTTKQEVGFYAALFQLGYYPITIAVSMAIQSLAPIFFQRAGDTSDKKSMANIYTLGWRLTWFALILSFMAFLIALLFHMPIFRLFVAKEYAVVSHLLPWMVLAGGLFAASHTITLTLMSEMKTRIMIFPKTATAILGVSFNFVGAYLYGIEGIVIAYMLFSAMDFLCLAGLLRRRADKIKNV